MFVDSSTAEDGDEYDVDPQEAVWWSEHIMTHKGCDHLKSPYRSLPDRILLSIADYIHLDTVQI